MAAKAFVFLAQDQATDISFEAFAPTTKAYFVLLPLTEQFFVCTIGINNPSLHILSPCLKLISESTDTLLNKIHNLIQPIMKELLRSMTKGCYDIQKLRIQAGNRVVANFKSKLGMEPSTKEDESDADAKEVLKVIRKSYDRITDGIEKITKRIKFDYDGVISNYSELCLINQYVGLLESEEKHFKKLKNILDNFEIWTEWLINVRGVGPAMGAVIVSEIDIHIAKYPSSIWKYAGLDVKNGEGRSRKKEHLEETEYVDSNGEVKYKKGITFNPFLKTKLVGVLGSSFLRAGGDYADIYYDYKHRITNMERHSDKSDGHIHNMAVRYMIKMFLKDLYSEWKEIEGLPQSPTYQEAKLEHEHNS